MPMATYQEVRISEVVISQQRRKTDAARVRNLAESIGEIGLQHFIGLTPQKTLIHGLHRLEAFKLLGRDRIPAMIHEIDELHAELAEIDENLTRSPLTALEESQALKRRKEIYERLHPETRAHAAGGHARHGSAGDRVSFAEDTARKTNIGRRTIERAVAVAQMIPDDIQELIADTPITDQKSQLEKLARLPYEDQRPVAEKLAAGESKTVEQAIDKVMSEPITDAGTIKPSPQPKCPNCGHNEFDPEDGDCKQCYEPGVVPPEVAEVRSDMEVEDDKFTKDSELESRPDVGLEFDESSELDLFLTDLERNILEHVNTWRAKHLGVPWHLITERFETMVKRIYKNLIT